MITLAIDTAGREGSVALAEAGHGRWAVLGLAPLAGGTYSAQLIPAIAALLASAGVAKEAVDLLAVNSGPGSFTGLRVGLSTVKGLAESLHQPIVAISGLEALAIAARLAPPTKNSSGRSGRCIAAMDAQRQEVYVGEYEISAIAKAESAVDIRQGKLDSHRRESETVDDDIPRAECIGERLISLAAFVAELASASAGQAGARTICTADAGIERALQAAGVAVEAVARPRADLIARIGTVRYRQGSAISPEALDANYIRRSDAEIFSTPASGAAPE